MEFGTLKSGERAMAASVAARQRLNGQERSNSAAPRETVQNTWEEGEGERGHTLGAVRWRRIMRTSGRAAAAA